MPICRLCPNCSVMLYGFRCSCGYHEINDYITMADYFRCYNRDPKHPAFGLDFREVEPYASEYTPEIEANARDLIKKINALFTELSDLTHMDFELKVNSGWRPKAYSREIGLSTRSNHTKGLAVDLRDIGNAKYDLLTTNITLLTKKDMAREHKSATRTWLHLQTVLPRSGRTTFYP